MGPPDEDLLNVKFEHASTVVMRRVAGEVILVPVTPRVREDPCLYTLDEVAAFLWEGIDGNRTGRDLTEALRAAYAVEIGQAEADVRQFLGQLESIQVISRTHNAIRH